MPASPLQFSDVCFVILLLKQHRLLMSELPMLETMGDLIRPICSDRHFNVAECFQKKGTQSLIKHVAGNYFTKRSTVFEQSA